MYSSVLEKLCFKPCNKKSMILMAALSETNAFVVEFYGNVLPTLLLPSSKYYGEFFSYVSI